VHIEKWATPGLTLATKSVAVTLLPPNIDRGQTVPGLSVCSEAVRLLTHRITPEITMVW
jgi:hypothetical protein